MYILLEIIELELIRKWFYFGTYLTALVLLASFISWGYVSSQWDGHIFLVIIQIHLVSISIEHA